MEVLARTERLGGGVVVLVVDQPARQRPAGRVGVEDPVLAARGAEVLFEMAGTARRVEACHPQRAVDTALAALEDADLVGDAPPDLRLHRPFPRWKLGGGLGAPALDRR